VLSERYYEQGFNGIYLVIFGFQNVGDIDFKVLSATKKFK
jgi:hypothetical protein